MRLEVKTDRKLDELWSIAESGLAIAKHNIAARKDAWYSRHEPYNVRLSESDLIIAVLSPRGKIDINHASQGILANLLTGLNYDPDRIPLMVDALLDWRDEDDLVRLNGAEAPEYQQKGFLNYPANQFFKSVDELDNVIGFSEYDVNCLAPYLTTFSKTGEVQVDLASPELRTILGLSTPDIGVRPQYRRSTLAGQVFEVEVKVSYSKHTDLVLGEIFMYTGIPEDPVWTYTQSRKIISNTEIQQYDISSSCRYSENHVNE